MDEKITLPKDLVNRVLTELGMAAELADADDLPMQARAFDDLASDIRDAVFANERLRRQRELGLDR